MESALRLHGLPDEGQARPRGGANATTSPRDLGYKSIAVNVSAVNDAPVVTVPGAQNVNEDTNLVITGISVGDADIGTEKGVIAPVTTMPTIAVDNKSPLSS